VDFRINKITKTVTVIFSDGTYLTGEVFLSPESPSHRGPERVQELFSGRKSFIPMRTSVNEVVFLHKRSIQMIKLHEPDKIPDPQCSLPYRVSFQLLSGREITGEVHVELPEHRRRVSDFLNLSMGFFLIESDGGQFLINPEHIRNVIPLEEALNEQDQ
jgi:hypothetical protein